MALIVTLALGLLVPPLTAEAQQALRVYRIGWLSAGPPPPMPTVQMQAFQQGLRDLGYVEGQNLVMEYRYAAGSAERLRDLAAELVRLPVDVIVAAAASGTRGAQHATRTIPIVMTGNYDPVGQGFVASLGRPGGNITGMSFQGTDLPGKRLEILKETVPQSTRIAVLANPASPGHVPLLNNLTVAAEALKLSLHVVELRHAEALDDAFTAMTRAGADALVVFGEPQLIMPLRGRIATSPPRVGYPRCMPRNCMWTPGPHVLWAKPARHQPTRRRLCGQDLKGANPADLPVEQPTSSTWPSTSRPPRPSASHSPVRPLPGSRGDPIGMDRGAVGAVKRAAGRTTTCWRRGVGASQPNHGVQATAASVRSYRSAPAARTAIERPHGARSIASPLGGV
jgi:putative ABC transport system substrate-binding protein